MTVHIVEVHNPFRPLEDTHRHTHEGGISVSHWLQIRYPGFKEFNHPTICILNGNPLMREDWGKTTLNDGDVLNFVAIPGDPVTIIVTALIVVAAVGITLALTPKPKTPGQIPEADPVYNLKGQKNQIRLMSPIEVPYGRVRLWPSYAARAYNKYQDNEQLQYQLFCLGHGEYEIDQVYIEDTPIEQFQDIEYEVTPPGQSVTLFPDNVITSVEIAALEMFGPNEPEYMSWYGGFVANDAFTQTNLIEVDIVLPNGLYYGNDDGGLNTRTVTAEFEYRLIDDSGNAIGSWTPLFAFSETQKTVNSQRFTLSQSVSLGRYEIRGRRTNDKDTSHRAGNTILWESLRAFLPSTKDYGAVTMLAVKARASNNLNDQASNRINVVGTRKLPVWSKSTGSWSTPQATRSIIWAFCDIFRSTYGGRLPDEYLDLSALYDMDLVFTGRNEYFDWIFDQKTTVWDAAKTIARVGRSIPMLNGSVITMIRDEPKTLPVAVFNQENIVADSFRWDIKLFDLDEHDSVEIEYTDATTWKPEEVLCVLPESNGDYPEKIKLPGCTNRDHAYHEGMFIAASNWYLRENITFKTGLEGHIPTFGDLISISHDIPRWGQAGFVSDISGNLVGLSDPVEFGSGNHYIVFRKKDGSAAGPYQVQPGGDDFHVVLINSIEDAFYFDSIHEPPLYQFGLADEWAKLCKVIDVRPGDKGTVEIVAVNYDPRIHTFDQLSAPALQTDVMPPSIPQLPVVSGLRVSQVPDTLKFVQVSWNPALGAESYLLQQSTDGTHWINVDRIQMTSYTLPIIKGYLYLRVAAMNVGLGAWDTWEGEVGVPVGPPNNVLGLQLQQAFTGTFVKIQWQSVVNASSYRIRVYQDNGATLKRIVDVSGLSYTYSIENALEDGSPKRDLQFQVVGVNDNGESETPAILNASNSVPSVVNGMGSELKSETATEAIFTLYWNASPEVDIAGYQIWGSAIQGFTPGAVNLLLDTTSTQGDITIAKIDHDSDSQTPDQTPTYYWRVASYDMWGNEVNVGAEQTIVSA